MIVRLLAALLVVCLCPGMSAAEYTYHNDEYGYVLTLPDNWLKLPETTLAVFRAEHGYRERATHPMVDFYQLSRNTSFEAPLIMVNVGDYKAPLQLSRFDYQDLAEAARLHRVEQQRQLALSGAFVKVTPYPLRRLVIEEFDISPSQRVALYTYFSRDRYWEFVFVHAPGSGRSDAVREALDGIILDREPGRGVMGLFVDTYREAVREYRPLLEDVPFMTVLKVGGGLVVFAVGVGVVYRWRERHFEKDA